MIIELKFGWNSNYRPELAKNKFFFKMMEITNNSQTLCFVGSFVVLRADESFTWHSASSLDIVFRTLRFTFYSALLPSLR